MKVIADKHVRRTQLRAQRAAVASSARQASALQAAQLFCVHPIFTQQQRFAAYCAHGNEFDLGLIIQALWRAQKTCYLPRLVPSQQRLHFLGYHAATPLVENQYHILEPEYDATTLLEPAQLDVVLLPLIAFNRQGARLGSGGGYYDRTFAFLRAQPQAAPMLIGVGFAFQEMPDLPHDDWDVQLQGILTEKEFTLFSNPA